MASSIYKVNKGINKPIEFKGLKAQYIGFLFVGVMALLILFALMYILGLPALFCIAVVLGLGAFLVFQVYRLSNAYGEHGLMKVIAFRKVPKVIRSNRRQVFFKRKK